MASFPENADWNPSWIRGQLIKVLQNIQICHTSLFRIHFNFTKIESHLTSPKIPDGDISSFQTRTAEEWQTYSFRKVMSSCPTTFGTSHTSISNTWYCAWKNTVIIIKSLLKKEQTTSKRWLQNNPYTDQIVIFTFKTSKIYLTSEPLPK